MTQELILPTLKLEKGIGEVSFNELASSLTAQRFGEAKPMNGIEHFELIEKLYEVITDTGLSFESDKIYINDAGEAKVPGLFYVPAADPDGSKTAKSYMIRRLITSMIIKDEEDETTNTKIALSFNQEGIMAAIGPNVKICSNLSIFGSENVVSTRGNYNKVNSIDTFIDTIRGWLQRFGDMRKRDQQIMSRMKFLVLNQHEVNDMIGDLHIRRLRKDEFKAKEMYPFTQSHINEITREVIKDREIYSKNNPNIDYEIGLWDLYNHGTNLHKPGQTSFTNIIPQNVEWGNYLINKYSLLN